jgi:hypothetical protein
MAHFAKLDKNNIVIQVDVVNNLDIKNENGVEQEQVGINFLHSFYRNPNDVWKQTSYNTQGGVHLLGGTPFRKNYAGIGYTYDSVRDAFIPTKPYNSWVLNEQTCNWEAPIAYPNDGQMYRWNEETKNWDLVIS